MRFGVIIPTAVRHEVQNAAWRSALGLSRFDTEVVALLNGITAEELRGIPSGISTIQVDAFEDECDLRQWCLEYASAHKWDWCLIMHDDLELLEGGWESDIEASKGWKVVMASHLCWTLWDSEACSGMVKGGAEYRIGVALCPASLAINVAAFRKRGFVTNLRRGFGYGQLETTAWGLSQGCAVWRLWGKVYHGANFDKNTRAVNRVFPTSHPGPAPFLNVLPAEVVDDEHVRVSGKVLKVAP